MKKLQKIALLLSSSILLVGISACSKDAEPEKPEVIASDTAVPEEVHSDIVKNDLPEGEGTDPLGELMNDSVITSNVKAALLDELGQVAAAVDVQTLDGVATLSGVVDSALQKDKAETIAAGVAGVKNVTNTLVIHEL